MGDFAIPKNPTNNDIMLILVQMNSTLQAVEAQAIKTNGRVNSIEEWKTGLLAVAEYTKQHPTAGNQTISAPNATSVTVMQPTKWFQSEKLVGGVVILLVAIAGLISYYAGRGGF